MTVTATRCREHMNSQYYKQRDDEQRHRRRRPRWHTGTHGQLHELVEVLGTRGFHLSEEPFQSHLSIRHNGFWVVPVESARAAPLAYARDAGSYQLELGENLFIISVASSCFKVYYLIVVSMQKHIILYVMYRIF